MLAIVECVARGIATLIRSIFCESFGISNCEYYSLTPIVQHKSDINSKIVALLIELKKIHGLFQRDIAREIAVDENHLSKVSKGKSNGSEQMLASLELLLDLCGFLAEQKREAEIFILQDRLDALKSGKQSPANYSKKAPSPPGDIKALLEQRRLNRERKAK